MDRFCTRLKLLAEGRLVEALQHTLAVPADKGDNDDVMEDDAHPGPQLFSAKDAQQRLPSAGGLASLVLLLQRRSLVMGGGTSGRFS